VHCSAAPWIVTRLSQLPSKSQKFYSITFQPSNINFTILNVIMLAQELWEMHSCHPHSCNGSIASQCSRFRTYLKTILFARCILCASRKGALGERAEMSQTPLSWANEFPYLRSLSREQKSRRPLYIHNLQLLQITGDHLSPSFSRHSLTQVVNKPTRGNIILDFLATGHPQMIEHVDMLEGISDHKIISTTVKTTVESTVKTKLKVYFFEKCPLKILGSL
jgi:hypothetical protein